MTERAHRRRDSRPVRFSAAVLLAGLGGVALAPLASGAPAPAARSAAAPAAAPAAAAPAAPAAAGLDALGDDAVMNELAARGINSLLNRLYDERKVPQSERDSFKSLAALRELSTARALSEAKRIKLLRESTEGLNSIKGKLTDANQLFTYALALVQRGIEPDVNILDYWGEDPSRQARIRQAANLVVEMMDRTSADKTAKANALENQLKDANDPKIKEYERLQQESISAKYFANIWTYYKVLAIDESGKKPPFGDRQAIAKTALDYLAENDNPDSQIGPQAKLLIAKIRMRCGDYAEARKQYQLVIDKKMLVDKKPVPMLPEPTEVQLNEAYYFVARCDVYAGKPAEAEKDLAALESWQKSVKTKEFADFVKDNGNQSQLLMLRYHIANGKAELATGPQKAKLASDADTLLEDLAKLNPAFRALVTEQLVTKLPDNADLTKASTSVLWALISRANGERLKTEKADEKMIGRGLQAAIALSNRKPGEMGALPNQVEEAKLYSAAFAQRLGKLFDAAKVYLDYADDKLNYGKQFAAESLDQALTLSSTLFRENSKDPAIEQLYDRMLKVGSNPPYNRTDLYYFYGQRLMTKEENLPEAIKFFAKVPDNDKRGFDARYWQMIISEKQLASTKDVALKVGRIRELLDIASKVRVLGQAALTSPDAAMVQKAKFRMANATLMEADLSLQQQPPQPKRTLQVLQGFDKQVAGLQQADGMSAQAMLYQARALILDNQLQAAVSLIEQLANDPKTVDFATNLVRDVLKQIEIDFKAAKAKNDRAGMRDAAKLKAQLSDLLGKVVKKDPDPEKQADNQLDIQSYQAATKFEAADLEDNPTEKQRLYKEALDVCGKLLPAVNEGIDRYTKRQATKADEATAKKLENMNGLATRVAFNQAKANYGLGNRKEAIGGFSTLLAQGKLGGAKLLRKDSKGELTIEDDNDDYWEATDMLNTARYEVHEQNPNDPDAQAGLKAAQRSVLPLFSVNPNAGGPRWNDKMQELRKKLDPTGSAGAATQPSTAPATQPAAAAK